MRMLILSETPQLSVLFLPAFGVGILACVYAYTVVCRGKMARA